MSTSAPARLVSLLPLVAAALSTACEDRLPIEPRIVPPPQPLGAPALVVSNVTIGGAFDPDGFQVRIDGSLTRLLQLNQTVSIQSLPAGSHTVELTGLAPNCTANGGVHRVATISNGTSARVSFEVGCLAPPELARLRVVFARTTGTERARIVAMNADGSGLVELTDGRFSDSSPDVSPDGKTIAFIRDDLSGRGQPAIYSLDVARGTIWSVIGGPSFGPRWSPDGSSLMFLSDVNHWGGLIHVARPDGSGATLLTKGPNAEDAWPAWSPDGTRVAFTRMELDACCGIGVYIVNADGTEPARLTESSPWGPMWPVWSNDGRIAFSHADGYQKTSRIKVMMADGSAVGTLLESDIQLIAHDWSADGRFLLFTKGADLYLLRLADGSSIRLTADGTNREPLFWPGAGG